MSDLQHIQTRIAEIKGRLESDPDFAAWADQRTSAIKANDERITATGAAKPTSQQPRRRFSVSQKELDL